MTFDVRLGIDEPPPETVALGVAPSGLVLAGVPTHVLPVSVRSLVEEFVTESEPSGKPGDVRELPLPGELPARVLIAGVGSLAPADLRLAGAGIARAAGGDVGVAIAAGGDELAALAEGLLLGGYRFDARPGKRRVTRAWLVCCDDAAAVARGVAYGRGAAWARELANTRAPTKTPTWMAQAAAETLTPLGVRVSIRDAHWLADQSFGGTLAVGRSSVSPPCLVEARWRPRGAAAHLAVVGKGITFDTGGYNLKPGASMKTMYTDVAGGAAALGALHIVAALRVPVAVTVLVPLAENAVSGSAMRPGDVIRHYGGRSTEIVNTDAEGRLVLADALAYAVARLRPDAVVDIATLTGGIKVALGTATAGLFTPSDELAAALSRAGTETGEPVWRMPLADDYADLLCSDIADANNSSGQPQAVTAAMFLRPFAADKPWAHLDIAGPGRSGSDAGLVTRGATGFGARLLARWIEARAVG
jgi:leucyl aminopeptidase